MLDEAFQVEIKNNMAERFELMSRKSLHLLTDYRATVNFKRRSTEMTKGWGGRRILITLCINCLNNQPSASNCTDNARNGVATTCKEPGAGRHRQANTSTHTPTLMRTYTHTCTHTLTHQGTMICKPEE